MLFGGCLIFHQPIPRFCSSFNPLSVTSFGEDYGAWFRFFRYGEAFLGLASAISLEQVKKMGDYFMLGVNHLSKSKFQD